MVIGDVRSSEVIKALRPAQNALGREMNATVYPSRELKHKASSGHPFITEVLKQKKIYLIGDEDDLKRVVG